MTHWRPRGTLAQCRCGMPALRLADGGAHVRRAPRSRRSHRHLLPVSGVLGRCAREHQPHSRRHAGAVPADGRPSRQGQCDTRRHGQMPTLPHPAAARRAGGRRRRSGTRHRRSCAVRSAAPNRLTVSTVTLGRSSSSIFCPTRARSNTITVQARLQQMCAAQVPGDTYRHLRISPQYSRRTFKHVLVPVWLLSYNYGARAIRSSSTATPLESPGDTREASGRSCCWCCSHCWWRSRSSRSVKPGLTSRRAGDARDGSHSLEESVRSNRTGTERLLAEPLARTRGFRTPPTSTRRGPYTCQLPGPSPRHSLPRMPLRHP
jgi:hypothetical protein